MVSRETIEPGGGAPACTRRDLAALLPEWDQLEAPRRSELLAHARACASCGADLALLQRAQAWLEGDAEAGACPDPEALYAMGRGPGARPLDPERREQLERHLSACPPCAAFSATLASRPPSPLELEPLAAPRPTELPAPTPPRRLDGNWRRWIPWAAAAAAVLALYFLDPRGVGGSGPRAVRYPEIPQLRGERPGPLLFPRGKVLAGPEGLWSPLVFELAAPPGASEVRVRLERHGGGAFDTGTPVATLRAASGTLPAGPELGNLPAGRYTWEAWATVDGLDQPLGRRDFEVVADAELLARLDSLARAREPERSEAVLALLHERGYHGDARAVARSLPESAAREAFLEAQSAR